MKIRTKRGRKVRIEMLPLIDIVFLLLVFFIYAMLSMSVHRGIPVALPSSSTARIDNDLVLSVTVRQDGSVYVDKQRIELDDLAEFLKTKARVEKKPGILLFVHRDLPYQELFRVMDQIRMSGLNTLSLQAELRE